MSSVRHFIFLSVTGVLAVMGFQNCSPSFFTKSDPVSAEVLKTSSSLSGNGDGYGGKLSGVYAQVDTEGRCSGSTAEQKEILSQVRFENGQVFLEIENCVRLSAPREVVWSDPETVSEDRSLFATAAGLYQKGSWIEAGHVPRDQYVDVFCKGETPVPLTSSSERRVEAAIFNHRDEFQPDGTLTPPGSERYLRVAMLRYTDLTTGTGVILDQGVVTYDEVVETVLTPPGSLERSHLFISGIQDVENSFSLSFKNLIATGELTGMEMTYANPRVGMHSVRPVVCWR